VQLKAEKQGARASEIKEQGWSKGKNLRKKDWARKTHHGGRGENFGLKWGDVGQKKKKKGSSTSFGKPNHWGGLGRGKLRSEQTRTISRIMEGHGREKTLK